MRLILLALLWSIAWPSYALAQTTAAADPGRVPFAQAGEWPLPAFIPVADGLSRPVHVTHAGDGSGRIFVVEQAGVIRIVANAGLLPDAFLDIRDRVGCCGERGLLSVAFPPRYGEREHFYVNYTDRSGDTVIARYRLTADPNQADAQSEQVVLKITQPYANHNGGQLVFGPADGYLYIGMGDGGSANDPQNRAQNPGVLLGKMLRVDVEAGTSTYVAPSSNPFLNVQGCLPEIWAVGLRNPWRFSFDRQTHDLYIADVGQGSYEEINFQPAGSTGGENYGWRIMEGAHCRGGEGCNTEGLVLPVAEYGRSFGCSVTGGFVYRGDRYPRLHGIYFYADYCSGNLWGLRRTGSEWQSQLLLKTPYTITTFGEDEEGSLYLVDYGKGVLYLLGDSAHQFYLPLIVQDLVG
jgi:glucose/arabinose dehydrogenase